MPPAFLYTNNERTEREIKETIPFTTAITTAKYWGIILPEDIEDQYSENYKILMRGERKMMLSIASWDQVSLHFEAIVEVMQELRILTSVQQQSAMDHETGCHGLALLGKPIMSPLILALFALWILGIGLNFNKRSWLHLRTYFLFSALFS